MHLALILLPTLRQPHRRILKVDLRRPAEVAVWSGGVGSLKYCAVTMTRSRLDQEIELLGNVVIEDAVLIKLCQNTRQLKRARFPAWVQRQTVH